MASSDKSTLTSMVFYPFTNKDVSTSLVEEVNQNLFLAQQEVLKMAL